MKNIIRIMILSLITTFQIHAQYQSIFGQTSTEWVFEWHNLDFGGQDTVYVEKDTTAFGQDWKKIMTTETSFFNGALLREDTTLGLVWYRALSVPSLDTVTYLLFDFSLNVGDTFNVDNMATGINGTSSIENTVDSVYFVNGTKFIRFSGIYYAGAPVENYTFIEGIGGNLGVLWKQYDGGLRDPYLLCSYKDGIQTLYQNKRYNGNCLFNGGNDIAELDFLNKSVLLFPNPAEHEITVEIKNSFSSISRIEIINIFGQVLHLDMQHHKIDISSLPSGNYFLRLTLDNDAIVTKKFQKN